mgnify:CR=1 FL=1
MFGRVQDERKKGKSKFNLNKYYDFAICGITQHSNRFPRKVISVCVIALIVMLLEFCFVALPNLLGRDVLSIANSVILRCILAAVLIAIIAIAFTNCAFIGIPLIEGVLGSEGVFYLLGYIVVFNI